MEVKVQKGAKEAEEGEVERRRREQRMESRGGGRKEGGGKRMG